MRLLIDRASTALRLSDDEFRRWAQNQTIFISSEMQDLATERRELAAELRELGVSVILFEDLGGRDEDAVTAYLDGVARCTLYLGIVANRYGRMQRSGRSPTHDEYLEARNRGKRISFWVATDGADRQGNARDFVQEIQTFHTTGGFADARDLVQRVIDRLREIAADELSPWVKVGEAVIRADVIKDDGARVEIEARVGDQEVRHYLQGLRADEWGRGSQVTLTTRDGSGKLTAESVTTETRAGSAPRTVIAGGVEWNDGAGDTMAAGTQGYSAEDLVELGLRVGLLGEALPNEIGSMSFMVDSSDPLAELPANLPHPTFEAVARLCVVEHLLASRKAAQLNSFAVGPGHQGRRRLSLNWTEPHRYSNVSPARRTIQGDRFG